MPTDVLFKLIPTHNNQVSQPLILDSIIYKAKGSEVSGNVISLDHQNTCLHVLLKISLTSVYWSVI